LCQLTQSAHLVAKNSITAYRPIEQSLFENGVDLRSKLPFQNFLPCHAKQHATLAEMVIGVPTQRSELHERMPQSGKDHHPTVG
jgi:hypothetical protein